MATPLLRILVIEDDRDIVELVRTALTPEFECFDAENGLEGLQRALLGEPDLIISDIMMPVMDGRAFIEKMRTFPGFEATPVIFLSALGSRDQIREGYELGAALYLNKPIDPKRLRRNIDLFVKDHDIVACSKRMTLAQMQEYELSHRKQDAAPHAEDMVVKPTSRAAMTGFGSKDTEDSDLIRVLVVEDDRDSVKMIRAGLSERFEMLDSGDGIDAIERAVRYKPDLFIIDGMLPKMTGYQLVMMLKKNRLFFKSPIVFISGKANDRDQAYVKKLGVANFLAKPFTVKQLNDVLNDIVSKPTFSIQKNRISARQAYLERFQSMATGAQPIEPMEEVLDQTERRNLEQQLKRQLH